jgi:hypothetical protein
VTDARGYTLVELLLAAALMLTITASVANLVDAELLRAPLVEEGADLHQRTRVAVGRISADLRAAGAGPEGEPLSAFLPAVLPRRAGDPITTALGDTVTVRYVPAGGARSRLATSLAPGDPTIVLDTGGVCVRNAVACGFTAGTRAIVFDGRGQADVVAVDGISAGALTVSDAGASRVASYAAGAHVAELTEAAYLHDPALRQVRRETDGSGFPFVENVLTLEFRYFARALAPSAPKPPPGVANCLYAADGSPVPLVSPVADLHDPIPLERLRDGPFCGIGPMAFDVDLLRVQRVRIAARLETAMDGLRGTDLRFFARPGTAAGPRVLPDIVTTLDVTLRNPGR